MDPELVVLFCRTLRRNPFSLDDHRRRLLTTALEFYHRCRCLAMGQRVGLTWNALGEVGTTLVCRTSMSLSRLLTKGVQM